MSKAFFITGTDTGVGKTTVSCALLAAARAQGKTTLALKPVASGCAQTPDGLRNDDALALMAEMTESLPYEQVNPVALAQPLSPHLAAAHGGRRLSVSQLAGFCRGGLMQRADFKLVEGAGGWRVPLNEREMLSALPKALGLPVILVVGLRLGCLNHAILSAEAIFKDGVRIAGWVGNSLEPAMAAQEENVATLKNLFTPPCLGILPWQPEATAAERGRLLALDLLWPG